MRLTRTLQRLAMREDTGVANRESFFLDGSEAPVACVLTRSAPSERCGGTSPRCSLFGKGAQRR
jgi:hypothetical protein